MQLIFWLNFEDIEHTCLLKGTKMRKKRKTLNHVSREPIVLIWAIDCLFPENRNSASSICNVLFSQ